MSEPPRSKNEALRSLKYRERLHFRHARFYRHVRAALAIVSLASGSAAVTAAVQSVPNGVAAAAFFFAFVTIIDAVGNFSEKAAKHGVWRRQAALTLAEAEPMDVVKLDAALNRFRADVDDEIESLRAVCWNDTLKSVGREDAMRPETFTQKLMRAMA